MSVATANFTLWIGQVQIQRSLLAATWSTSILNIKRLTAGTLRYLFPYRATANFWLLCLLDMVLQAHHLMEVV